MAEKLFTFSGVLWTDRTNFYPSPQQLAVLYPAVTPFLSGLYAGLPANAPTLPAPDYKFFEYRAGWRYQYLDVNAASPNAWSDPGAGVGTPGATVSFDVDNVTGLGTSALNSSHLGMMVEIWNSALDTYKGVAIVTVVTDTDTITLKAVSNPASATQTMTALADNDRLFVIGSAHGEETVAPDANSDELEVVFNSCHLERTAVEIGRTLAQAALRGDSDELARLRMSKGNEHKIKCARALYFGARPGGIGGVAHGAGGGTDSTFVNHITDANSKTVRTTMGIFSALRRYGRTSGDQQNVFSFTEGTMDYNDLVDVSEKIFQYSADGGVKDLYAGPGFVTFLNKIGAEGMVTRTTNQRVNITLSAPETNRVGMRIQYLDLAHGTVRIINDPLLRGTPYSSHALIVDPANVSLARYEADSYETNIKTDNNPRLIKDEFSSFMGAKLTLMESHSWIQLS